MQMTYKLLRKTPDEHMSLKSVLKYFPDQNELQMRQRMKVCTNSEYALHVRLTEIIRCRNSWSITEPARIKGFGV